MNIIDSTNTAPFTYVVLPPTFEIKDEAQIIFAPNGIGKTTLFKILKSQNSGKCEIYTYDGTEEPTYKIVDGKKKKLEINPLPSNYTQAKQIADENMELLSSKEIMSSLFGSATLSTIKKKTTNQTTLDIASKGMITNFVPLDATDRANLKYILNYPSELKKLLLAREELKALTDAQKSADLETLKLIDRKFIYKSYKIENHEDDIKKDGCPLCGRNDTKVYDDMLRIRKEVEDAKFNFFENYTFLLNIPENTSKLVAINQTIDAIIGLSDNKYFSLLKSEGNLTLENQLTKALTDYNKAKSDVARYISERDVAYNNMSSSKSTIEKYFPLLYPNSSVKFDNTNKTITISMPRNMETYSEGEKHEMYSTVRELTIIGSDKELVIADDPLTDLDVANEYKNVFRFVKLANENHKKVIIFTCNPNLINIANEYHNSIFKRYYLISHVDLSTNSIGMDLIEMDFKDKKGAYICLKQIYNLSLNDITSEVVNLLYERTNLDISGVNPARSDEISKILHYDNSCSVTIGSSLVSNDQLVDAIDRFVTLPSYSSFTTLAKERVFYLVALRVFIEKKLFDYQQERISRGLSDCFPMKRGGGHYLTKDKIIAVHSLKLSGDSYPIDSKYPNWNKSSLMCLKTMLNDNDHPYSQILPLTYALSIGNDAFIQEIKNVKEIFS